MKPIYGGIEAGGAKFVCVVGSSPTDVNSLLRIPTTTPTATIDSVIKFFQRQSESTRLAAIGIGSFGPLDLDPKSVTFGYITSTPKFGWTNTNFVEPIRSTLGRPVAFDTDVNTAAIAEHRWGAAQGLNDFIYLTVGSGIGGSAFANGGLVHGLTHPEMGHIQIPHDRNVDPYKGSCRFHGDCFEGLASGPAISKRWNESPENLPTNHPAWAIEGEYIALGITNLIYTYSPQRIVLGGGVIQQHLLDIVRKNVLDILGGYIQSPMILDDIEGFIVPPALGDLSGALGAIALAHDAIG